MTTDDLILAARVPASTPVGVFGLWEIHRQRVQTGDLDARRVGFPHMTVLTRTTLATLHRDHGEVVMEDSLAELRKHLPFLLRARGRVLVSGLGLGCVVRALLAKPEVERVDVVEIDPRLAARVGSEFARDPRYHLYLGDALTIEWPADARWDYAWHDICEPADSGEERTRTLHELHLHLMFRYRRLVRAQGAWAMPREFKRILRRRIGGVIG